MPFILRQGSPQGLSFSDLRPGHRRMKCGGATARQHFALDARYGVDARIDRHVFRPGDFMFRSFLPFTLLVALSCSAFPQAYPNKPVRIVIASSAEIGRAHV